MVEEFDDAGQDAVPVRDFDLVFEDFVQEHFERVREVDQVRVMGREKNGFARLRAVEMESKDVVQEEVGLEGEFEGQAFRHGCRRIKTHRGDDPEDGKVEVPPQRDFLIDADHDPFVHEHSCRGEGVSRAARYDEELLCNAPSG